MTTTISNFMKADDEKIEKLIEEYPYSIPTKVIAEFLGMDVTSVQSVLENGVVGLSWKKEAKSRRGFFVPTAHFLRWYMRLD